MTRTILILLIGFLSSIVAGCSDTNLTHDIPLVPRPAQIVPGSGNYLFSGKTVFAVENEEQAEVARSFIALFTRAAGFTPKLTVGDAEKGNVRFQTDATLKSEAYTLQVSPKEIIIEASDAKGFFYALQTIRQLLPASIEKEEVSDKKVKWSIPAVSIQDEPRFGYRALLLDASRFFIPKENVLRIIDCMAMLKINTLHFHLTDDNGWRIEIKKYPLLTEFAAWRTDAHWKTWWNGGRKYLRFDEPGASGGYYTQDDIREIVEYARQHFITIIPEIEMPAHSEEVLAAYPQLSCAGEPYKNADFCIGNEETFTFLENVLTEVMALFPSEYIHIGGDEAGMAAWKTCPKCQKRMKDEHLSHVDELQSYLIHRIEKFLNDHGRRLLGWDEILKGGLAPNATVMSWRGEEGGITAVTSGHRAIMTPGGYCYLDSYQDAPYSQPEAIGGYLPLKKVYSYNPVSTSLSAEQAKLVYGAQVNLFTEYVPTPEHVEYMLYPRTLALAEVAWSAPERKSWPDFHARALKAVTDLQAKGYHTFDLKSEIGSRPESLQPLTHLALGKKVIYNAPYNSSYAAQGDVTLTDGIRGDWTYGDGAWQGFISKNRLDVTVDMENETTIHSVTAAFMQVVGAEVFLPASVVISVSDDGVNFTELKHQDFVVNKEEAIKFSDVSWEGTVKGRYVRYQARAGKELGGWIFTDEIIVK